MIDALLIISNDSKHLEIQKRDFYIERALKVFSILQNFDEAKPANEPLNVDQVEKSEVQLGYALDLQTISLRLANRFYRYNFFETILFYLVLVISKIKIIIF